MSEYQFVEKRLLQQLASMGWKIIEHGKGIPQNPSLSLRTSFREVLLKTEFIAAIKALNPVNSIAPNSEKKAGLAMPNANNCLAILVTSTPTIYWKLTKLFCSVCINGKWIATS